MASGHQCESFTQKSIVLDTVTDASRDADSAYLTGTGEAARKSPTWADEFRLRHWGFELVLCVVSLASFLTIILVLHRFDEQPLEFLPLNITLNAFLAFFTTLAKAGLLLPLTEAVSQWKWNLYQSSPRGRPLMDFQVLDNASRGVWGALSVLGRFKLRNAVTIAAFVSITSIATSPVTQQMVSYVVRPASDPRPLTNPTLQSWYLDDLGTFFPRKPIKQSLQGSVEVSISRTAPNCPTGNCTFGIYKSLAVCTKVADISSFLTVTKLANTSVDDWFLPSTRVSGNGVPAYNASLPNGFTVVTPVVYAAELAVIDSENNASLAFMDNNHANNVTALSHAFLIYSNSGNLSSSGLNRTSKEPWSFRAIEILFHMCVNSYQTEVVDGVLSTNVVKSSYAGWPEPGNYPILVPSCYPEGDTPESTCDYPGMVTAIDGGDGERFEIRRFDGTAMSYALGMELSIQMAWNGAAASEGTLVGTPAMPLLSEAIYGPYFNIANPDTQMQRVTTWTDNIATSLSNFLLTSARNTTTYTGVAWHDETYVKIRWRWVSFLAVQLLVSFGFLVVRIVTTRWMRMPIIKSSALATLLASTESVRSIFDGGESRDVVETRARAVKVRFVSGRLELVE